MLLNALPFTLGRVRLTHLLFGALLAPLAPVLYLATKVIGRCYRLTEGAVEAWPMFGSKPSERVRLDQIARIETRVRRGQAFYRAGDVQLIDAAGQTQLTLDGVPQPERVRAIIENLQRAAAQRDDALRTIAARSRQPVTSA